MAYGLLVIFVYEFGSPFLNLSHGLGVLHPEFVFHLSLVISCYFLSGPTGHLSLACLLWAGSEDFGSHPFNHLSSWFSRCSSPRCCLALGGLGLKILALTYLWPVPRILFLSLVYLFVLHYNNAKILSWYILFGLDAGVLYGHFLCVPGRFGVRCWTRPSLAKIHVEVPMMDILWRVKRFKFMLYKILTSQRCAFLMFVFAGRMGVLEHVNDRSSGKGTRNIPTHPNPEICFWGTLSRRSSKGLWTLQQRFLSRWMNAQAMAICWIPAFRCQSIFFVSPATAATWSTCSFSMCNCVRVRSHARQVSCHASSVAALLEQDKVSVADVLTLNKAGSFSCEHRQKLKGNFFSNGVFHQKSWEPVFWKFYQR